MNKLYKLCEFGISITSVKRLIAYSVENIEIISGIDEVEKKKIKEILESDEYIKGASESVYELINYGFSMSQIQSLIKKNITIDSIKTYDVRLFDVNARVKDNLLKFKKNVLNLLNDEQNIKENEIEVVEPVVVQFKKMNKRYKLCEYGIPYNIVTKLINYDENTFIESIYKDDGYINQEIRKVIESKEYIEDSNESIYELITLGLTEAQVEYLANKKITVIDIFTSNIAIWDIPVSLKNDLVLIKKQMLKKYEELPTVIYKYDFKENLERYIKENNEKRNYITKKQIFDYFKNAKDYKTEFFEECFNELVNEKIIFIEDGYIIYKFQRCLDIIEEIDSKRDLEIIKKFCDGNNLTQLAIEYGYTRGEAIIHILRKYFNSDCQGFEDIEYAEIFQQYDWNEDIFCRYFKERKATYIYLNFKYKKGKRELYLLYEEKNISEFQKGILDEYYGIAEVYGERIVLKKVNLLKAILKNEVSKPKEIRWVVEKYNEYAIKFNINPILQIDSFIRKIESYDFVLMSESDKIKYYDFSYISVWTKLKIKGILDVEPGEYDIEFLLNKEEKFWNEINIYTPRELHGLLRKIDIESLGIVNIVKYPYIHVKIDDKKEFFESILSRISPIKINEAGTFFTEYYGHKPETVKAYISMTFFEYIKDDIIDMRVEYIDDEMQEILKEQITEDIYSIEDCENIFRNIYDDEVGAYLNRYNINLLGYIHRGAYIIKNSFINVDNYFKEFIRNKKIINIEEIPYYSLTFMYSCLKRFETSYDIIKTENDKYINFEVLKEAGITKQDIIEYGNDVINEFGENEFFTMKNVRDRIPPKSLDDEGFSEKFYESIIFNAKDIRIIKLDNNNIYYVKNKNDKLRNADDFVNYIIENLLKERDVLTYNELIEYLEKKYDIVINDYAKIKKIIIDSEYYYNEIFRKIYKNKSIYLKEIYS